MRPLLGSEALGTMLHVCNYAVPVNLWLISPNEVLLHHTVKRCNYHQRNCIVNGSCVRLRAFIITVCTCYSPGFELPTVLERHDLQCLLHASVLNSSDCFESMLILDYCSSMLQLDLPVTECIPDKGCTSWVHLTHHKQLKYPAVICVHLARCYA